MIYVIILLVVLGIYYIGTKYVEYNPNYKKNKKEYYRVPTIIEFCPHCKAKLVLKEVPITKDKSIEVCEKCWRQPYEEV